MKALDLIKGNEKLLLEEAVESKKIKTLSREINELITAMNAEMNKFAEFKQSQIDGDFHYHAVVAKSLAEFFKGNKHLRVEDAVARFESLEKQNMNSYYQTKTKLLSAINSLIKETAKEAAVSYFDLFEGELRKCEEGHEIIILGDRNNILLRYIVEELDSALVITGHFAELVAQGVDYNLDTLNRNVDLCTRKNNEVYGTKAGKLAKIQIMIDKLNSVGNNVVAFYTYKDALLDIGCNPKGVKSYESELSKEYIPLKKGLQKEFQVELEDICNVTVNEESFPVADTNNIERNYSTPTLDGGEFESVEESSPFTRATNEDSNDYNPFESANLTENTFDSVSEVNPFESSQSNSTESDLNPFENTTTTNNWSNPFASNTEPTPTNAFSEETQNDSVENNPFETYTTKTTNVDTNSEKFDSEINTSEDTSTAINTSFSSYPSANDNNEENPFTSPLSGSGVTTDNPFANSNPFSQSNNTTNNNPFDSNPFDN